MAYAVEAQLPKKTGWQRVPRLPKIQDGREVASLGDLPGARIPTTGVSRGLDVYDWPNVPQGPSIEVYPINLPTAIVRQLAAKGKARGHTVVLARRMPSKSVPVIKLPRISIHDIRREASNVGKIAGKAASAVKQVAPYAADALAAASLVTPFAPAGLASLKGLSVVKGAVGLANNLKTKADALKKRKADLEAKAKAVRDKADKTRQHIADLKARNASPAVVDAAQKAADDADQQATTWENAAGAINSAVDLAQTQAQAATSNAQSVISAYRDAGGPGVPDTSAPANDSTAADGTSTPNGIAGMSPGMLILGGLAAFLLVSQKGGSRRVW